MAAYVDDAIWDWHGLRWCHLLADSVDELHRFAAAIGIHRISYQGPPKTGVPHYDLTAFERRIALARGATPCSRHEIVAVLRRVRPARPAGADNAAPLKPIRQKRIREDRHAQDLGPRHVGQRAEGDVGHRRAGAAS